MTIRDRICRATVQRYTALAVTLWLAFLAGCAHLPSADLVTEWRNSPSVHAVRVSGGAGPLSAKRSAEIINGIGAKVGDLDILQKHVAVEQAVVGSPLVAGNKATLLQDGPATYRAMFEVIRQATDHINLETYIIEDDEIGNRFVDLLLERQSHGVQVNIIYDSVGAIHTPRSFFDRLRSGGVRVLEFNPVNPINARKDWRINNRDHRKLLIVDGRQAFIGGLNISRVYSSGSSAPRDKDGNKDQLPWRDTHLQLEGPVVEEFQKLFLETWNRQHGSPLPPANYFPRQKSSGGELVRAIGSTTDAPASTIYLTLLSAIANAEKKIHITSAYFVPDPQLVDSLTDAARRGVDVTLILPGRTDFWAVFHAGRSRYAELLKAGVKIYERRDMLLHSKTAVIDGVWSCIGSANLDWRSFLHNEEVNAVLLGPGFAEQMENMFAQDLDRSHLIDPVRWEHRPWHFRLQEWSARLWEYWL